MESPNRFPFRSHGVKGDTFLHSFELLAGTECRVANSDSIAEECTHFANRERIIHEFGPKKVTISINIRIQL